MAVVVHLHHVAYIVEASVAVRIVAHEWVVLALRCAVFVCYVGCEVAESESETSCYAVGVLPVYIVCL